MVFTGNTYGYYLGYTGIQQGLSPPLLDFDNNTDPQPGLSAPILDQFPELTPPQGGMSAPLYEVHGFPVNLVGVNLASGQFQAFNPGDIVVRSDGTSISSTGLFGQTGVLGFTGMSPSGSTGILGATGIAGQTGVRGSTGSIGFLGPGGAAGLQGGTGLIGATGLQGGTGFLGEEGHRFLGATGVQGQTGILGTTGVNIQGVTGIRGTTGVLQGNTGVQGLTGIRPDLRGLQGATGLIGVTGVQGLTGLGATGLAAPLVTLSSQTTPAQQMSYSVLGNTLSVNEDYLHLVAFGTVPASATTTLQLTWGTTILANLPIYMDQINAFYLECYIFRNSATQELCFVDVLAANDYKVDVRTIASEDLAQTNLLSLSVGTGGSITGFVVHKS
jgi:hypothetical protein